MKRHYGWKRQPRDDRDFRYVPPLRLLRSLPSSMDLGAGMGPQLDQGSLGACGPNSADELIEFDQRAEGRTSASVSRLFVYYATRLLMGTVRQDSGVDNRTLLKALAKSGYCDEKLWPYVVSRFAQKPPAGLFTAATANAIRNYAAVAQAPDHMRGCLVAGRPFLFGFTCYPGLESQSAARTGIVPLPKKSERPIGGHDVTIFAYDDAGFGGRIKGPAYKFRNHWLNDDGSPWGDHGNGYLPAAYAENANLAGDFWVINAVP